MLLQGAGRETAMVQDPPTSKRCDLCGASFPTGGQLEEHVQRVHHVGNP